jgi:hypothetical protein
MIGIYPPKFVDRFICLMTHVAPNVSMSTSWSQFLDPPGEYDPSAPLVRTCSRELDISESWINSLICEASTFSQSPTELCPLLEPYSELEDRRVEISNFDPETTTQDTVLSEGLRHGHVESVDMSESRSGRIIVKFSDLRHAYAMRRATIRCSGFTWQLQFAHPEKIADPKKPPNNGTLVLFHVPSNVTDAMLIAEFGKYGDIREVRSRQDQRFVEFWDTRACESAMTAVKGTKLFGSRISVEYSRPGGFRKNPDAFLSHRKPVVARVARRKVRPAIDQGPRVASAPRSISIEQNTRGW